MRHSLRMVRIAVRNAQNAGMKWNVRSIGVYQEFTMKGVHVVGPGQGVCRTEIPSGVQRQSRGKRSGGRSPQKLKQKQNVKFSVHFLTFSCRKFRI